MKHTFLMIISLAAVLAAQSFAWAETGADPASGGKRLITVEDFGKTKDVSVPRLSPDGKQIAFASEGQVFVVSVGPGTPRAVTSKTSHAREPKWSADGKALYFLSDRSGSSQLWKLPLDTFGEAVQMTEFEFPLHSINLSPDESRLLITRRLPRENEEQEGESAPWVIDRLQFKEDAGDGYITNDSPDHYFIHDLETGSTRQISTGTYSEYGAAWSPDGESVVFVSNREPEPDASYRTDVWRRDVADDGGNELHRLTDSARVKQAPAWSPDGGQIAYITAEDGVYGVQHVAIVPASGGNPKILTSRLDRWVSAFRFSADGEWIYVQYDNAGATHLARIRIDGGEIQTLIQGEYVVSGFDIDQEGRVAARIATNNHSADIYALDGSKLSRLSHVNKRFFDGIRLGAREKVVFSSEDGTRVEAFVTTPPGFESGRRYPTILHIHGGPVGQFTYEYGFGAQFFAAKGYVVVEPNPRGSTGHGQSFINAIFETWGVTDYPDVIAAVDHVIEMGYADPDKLAVFGYSYGGYLTNVVITRTNRFKAAASGAGHSLIIANYGHDIYQKWYNWELGGPWENPSKYELLSPLLRVGEVETPTIFLGGRQDWNVPVLNAELYYQSLRHRGVPTRLVVYPDSHHGGWDSEFNKDYLSRISAWFDKYVRQVGD